MSCPYYGMTLMSQMPQAGAPSRGLNLTFLDSGGNQCPWIPRAFAPCAMETSGLEPDWKTCPVRRDLQEMLSNDKPSESASLGGRRIRFRGKA